jgi:hypothetical protein
MSTNVLVSICPVGETISCPASALHPGYVEPATTPPLAQQCQAEAVLQVRAILRGHDDADVLGAHLHVDETLPSNTLMANWASSEGKG